jgi:hypothetical protein
MTITTVKKEQRVCSECGKSKTRIHKWGPMRSDGVIPEYAHWYRDGKRGFKCFSCYMRSYWQKRRKEQEKKKL